MENIVCSWNFVDTFILVVLLCALELCYIGEYIIQHQPSHSSIKRLIKFENIRFIFQASLLWLYFIQIWNSVKSNSILDIFIRFNFLHIKQFFCSQTILFLWLVTIVALWATRGRWKRGGGHWVTSLHLTGGSDITISPYHTYLTLISSFPQFHVLFA